MLFEGGGYFSYGYLVYIYTAITVGDYRTGCSLAFVGPQIKNAAELYAKFYINPLYLSIICRSWNARLLSFNASNFLKDIQPSNPSNSQSNFTIERYISQMGLQYKNLSIL